MVNVTLSWALISVYGLNGAGIAFLGSYVFHGLLIYPIVRRLSGFRWSAANWRMGQAFIGLIGFTFASFQILPPALAMSVGVFGLLASVVYSMMALSKLVYDKRAPSRIARVIAYARAFRSSLRRS